MALSVSLQTGCPDENRLVGVKFELDTGDLLPVLPDILEIHGAGGAGMRIHKLWLQPALEPHPGVDGVIARIGKEVIVRVVPDLVDIGQLALGAPDDDVLLELHVPNGHRLVENHG